MKKFLGLSLVLLVSIAAIAKERGLFNFVAPTVHDTATNTDLAALSDVGTIVYDTTLGKFLGLDSSGAWQSISGGVASNPVTNTRSGGVHALSAMIDGTGTPSTVSGREDGNWINTITDNGVGDYTLNFVSGTFSSAANCACSGIGNGVYCQINSLANSTSSSIRIETEAGGVNVDTSFSIICVGAP